MPVQCYEILLNWLDHRDWEQAFYAVIPSRKFTKSGEQVLEAQVGDDLKLENDELIAK